MNRRVLLLMTGLAVAFGALHSAAAAKAGAPTAKEKREKEMVAVRSRCLTPGAAGVRDRFLKRIGRSFDKSSPEVAAKQAKAKPIDQPILETDWNRSAVTSQDALLRTSAVQAWGKATGRNQVVAVLDGGFDLGHEFLAGHLAEGYDALDDDNDAQDLGNGADDDGDGVGDRIVCHGTFVSSLVLACAPDARIMPIRVLDDEGWGTDLSVAAAIDFAVSHRANVINMSLVLPDATPMVKNAVRAAIDAGVVIISAAGTTDDGWQSDPYLASHASIVGATDAGDMVTPWTDSGPDVGVFAPGLAVRGALGRKFGSPWTPAAYGRWSGTSFSVAFLSAGAAMIRQKHPADWTAANVVMRLESTVDPAYTASRTSVKTAGRVDLGQALAE
jgi:serine protease